ncbi:MAG: hypothetical protein JXQ90_05190 [Cyclobacteriaceae bacterium]
MHNQILFSRKQRFKVFATKEKDRPVIIERPRRNMLFELIRKKFPSISSMELIICESLARKESEQQMSGKLSISTSSVKIIKSMIQQKMGGVSEQNMQNICRNEYIQSYSNWTKHLQ